MNRFDIVRGQAKTWSVLAGSYAAGRVASTYLLSGPEGVGTWSVAIEFAALLNCESPLTESETTQIQRPCGECRPCRSIFGLNFEGLHLIVPIPPHKNLGEAIDLTNAVLERKRQEPLRLLDKSAPLNIPIELARETKRRLAIQAPAGITRVVLFYQMERMRASSADALLKLIEEPPEDTVIILTAAQPEALLPTILSRARKIRLGRPPEPVVVEYIVQHCGASESAAQLAARVCNRSLGRAIEMIVGGTTEGSDQRSVGLLLFKVLVLESSPNLVAQMTEMLNFRDRGAAEDLIHLWQALIRDCAYFANTDDRSELVNIDFTSEIELMAPRMTDPSVVEQMVITTKNTLADLRLNVHIQPALVAMALKLKANMELGGRDAATG